MTKGLRRTLDRARAAAGGGAIAGTSGLFFQTIAFDKLIVVPDPGAAIAFASAPLGLLPQGNLWIGCALAYATLTNSAGVGLIAAFTGSFSIGSAPTADATLAGADLDIVPSTVYLASAGATPRTRAAPAVSAAPVLMTNNATFLDNTAGDLEANFNLTVADTSISAQATIRVVGELHLVMAVLGDD